MRADLFKVENGVVNMPSTSVECPEYSALKEQVATFQARLCALEALVSILSEQMVNGR